MRKDGDNRSSGGTKKFLYTGPKSKEQQAAEEEQWTFTPRKNNSPSAAAIDLDDVWSIKKNVGIGNAQQDRLSLNANRSFYSRHGGMKDKNTSSSSQGANDGKWAPGRRGYSYSSNTGASLQDQSSRGMGTTAQSSKFNDEFDF